MISILYLDLCDRGGFEIKQALHNGEISFDHRHNCWEFASSPHQPDAWQRTTAVVLLSLAYQKARYGRL